MPSKDRSKKVHGLCKKNFQTRGQANVSCAAPLTNRGRRSQKRKDVFSENANAETVYPMKGDSGSKMNKNKGTGAAGRGLNAGGQKGEESSASEGEGKKRKDWIPSYKDQ